MKRRRDLPNVKLPELHNNPLDLFPTKGDVIRRAFLHSKSTTDIARTKDRDNNDSEEKEDQQWLSPTKIDPTVCFKGTIFLI